MSKNNSGHQKNGSALRQFVSPPPTLSIPVSLPAGPSRRRARRHGPEAAFFSAAAAAALRPSTPLSPAEETKETSGGRFASGPEGREGRHLSAGRKSAGRLPGAPRCTAPQGQAPCSGLYARRAAKNAAPRAPFNSSLAAEKPFFHRSACSGSSPGKTPGLPLPALAALT